MRGHWLSTTRKLNRHYQSGGAVSPSGSYYNIIEGVNPYGIHYIGFNISGKKYKFNRLVFSCLSDEADHFVYQPQTSFYSLHLLLHYKGDPCTTNPAVLCPANGSVYTVHDINGVAIETITADFTQPLSVIMTGFSKVYTYIDINVATFFNVGTKLEYTLTIGV